jgi:hypothetical protein
VLHDTDAGLDVLLARRPHLAASGAAPGLVEGYLAARTSTILAYLLQRRIGPARSRVVLADLLPRLRVAAVTGRTIRTALASAFRDGEDAVCHAAQPEAGARTVAADRGPRLAGSRAPGGAPERASLPVSRGRRTSPVDRERRPRRRRYAVTPETARASRTSGNRRGHTPGRRAGEEAPWPGRAPPASGGRGGGEGDGATTVRETRPAARFCPFRGAPPRRPDRGPSPG